MSSDILEICRVRGISEILHFTTNLGLTGCLHTRCVLPRNKLRLDQQLTHILTLNAPFRAEESRNFDKSEDWINYINLSVSEITYNLFKHSLKWHDSAEIYWVIMAFDPGLLVDEGVYFSTTNSIYPMTARARGAQGFLALFQPEVRRKAGWVARRGLRADRLPTCEQAEVLYPARLDLSYLTRIYVREAEEADSVWALLEQFERVDVGVVVNPEKFYGQPT